MEIKEFIKQYPEAKDNPLKYAVESKMREKGWNGGSASYRAENSILLQDFVIEVNELVKQINETLKTKL